MASDSYRDVDHFDVLQDFRAELTGDGEHVSIREALTLLASPDTDSCPVASEPEPALTSSRPGSGPVPTPAS